MRVDKINSYPIRRARRNNEVFKILACSQFDINTRFESIDPNSAIYRHYPNILFDAVIDGDGESVRTILDCGGNTEVRDDEGKTPLLRAALVNDYDMVFLLLRNGADATVRDNDGNDFLLSLENVPRNHSARERQVRIMVSKRGLHCQGA
ncbi:ankyrin repeat domain-containing protein [Croceibacterium aestuarii]|uniref:ankyrin repeat domain-containing protein n=1 Tax=Croceibacterium aestuarii TaxID=3064139 RepID=UPI0034E1BED7